MSEDTVVSQRLVCDHVRVSGGVTKVAISKDLLHSCATARTKYRAHLDEEKRKREIAGQKLKRKHAEEKLGELKKRKKIH